MNILSRNRVVVAGVVVLAAVGMGGLAYAVIPDADGVIHACYDPKGAGTRNGTPLRVIDSDVAECPTGAVDLTWNQEGPAGPPGQDGQDGADGQNGADGRDGVDGQDGADGLSAAFTHYGDFQDIGDGLTKTVASVTVPAGAYTLTGAVQAIGVDDGQFLQCNFIAASPVNGRFAVLVDDGDETLLSDVTLSSPGPIFFRCNANGGEITAAGQMIAQQVNTVTQSE